MNLTQLANTLTELNRININAAEKGHELRSKKTWEDLASAMTSNADLIVECVKFASENEAMFKEFTEEKR